MRKQHVLFFVVAIFILLGLLYKQASNKQNTTNITSTPGSTTEQTAAIKNPENVLDLSNKSLDKMPSYVLNMPNLEELNISNNKLTGALPAEIHNLTKLRVLNASNNIMTGVPAEVGQLQNLEVLDLSNNKLTGLPNELGNLKKLKVLNLSGNNYSKQDLETIKRGLSPTVNIIL